MKRAFFSSGSSGSVALMLVDPAPGRAPAAAGRGRGNSGSRAPPPWSASSASRPWSESNSRVSCSIVAAALDAARSGAAPRTRSPADEADRVDVLDLAARAERAARLAHRDVDVAAHGAFLHVAVAGAEIAQDRAQLAQVRRRLLRRAHVGLRDDLHQRDAGAVEIDIGLGRMLVVQALAGVLLQVQARDADLVRLPPSGRSSTISRPCRRSAACTARSDSRPAGRDRSSSCGRTPRPG